MKQKSYRYFVGDFETTVYEGQIDTQVWASACVELYSDNVSIVGSIKQQFDNLKNMKSNIIIYYHNLKFDGSFWIDFLLTQLKMKQAFCESENKFVENKYMKNNTFKYSISNNGQWYSITIKTGGYFIEIRDSLKLLPFSVKKIGKSFGTKHKKLEMEYNGFRYPNCYISDEEKKYIENDVLVVKEALEIMFDNNHKSMTIGACCLKEYKSIIGKKDWDIFFPYIYNFELDKKYKYKNADEYIRNSYKGGWCYVVKGKEGIIFEKGCTADVNSLYPSMMHSQSKNIFPVGEPYFWKGEIPNDALKKNRYFFVRIKTRFYLKEGYLPFIQLKNNPLYKGTECLETTDIYDYETNEYCSVYYDEKGNKHSTDVELTLTMTDYFLFLEHYNVEDFEILDGCWFFGECGIFDIYIDKYKEIKTHSSGAVRELAKLFLNNLYGKLATNTNSSFKVAYIKVNGVIGFKTILENNKKACYIPCGSAITSYARNFTIRTAQKNYHGKNKRGFIYADTDSIHCDLTPNDLIDVPIHESDFCKWKIETCWDRAIFSRQKTYIEHVTHENFEKIEKPYNLIKCAGMPEKCKQLLNDSLEENDISEKKYNQEEIDFVSIKRNYKDFRTGLVVPSKLLPKRIKGGILLKTTTYQMRD